MRKINVIAVWMFFTLSLTAQKIKVYFNRPVNSSFNFTQPAVALTHTLDDTLASYINRSKSSLDIAVYDFYQSDSMANVIGALNNAALRGVKIRMIHDGGNPMTSINLLNPSIKILNSPTTSTYGIMHNKFMVIDADSSNAKVWTGSTNWTSKQLMLDVNNVIIIEDSLLANAYKREFEQMWGSQTMTADTLVAKFGPRKVDVSQHVFTIDGKQVEVYFSPYNGVNNRIVNAINSTPNEFYFGVYTFTSTKIADTILSKYQQSNSTIKGIVDNSSSVYTPWATLSPVMTTDFEKYNAFSTIYHNKLLIGNPSPISSNPFVLTGSHNWTVSADTKNDENTLIIHDATLTNQYMQSFAQNFIDLGGVISPPNGLNESELIRWSIFPNPFANYIQVETASPSEITIYNSLGMTVRRQNSKESKTTISTEDLPNGAYIISIHSSKEQVTTRLIKSDF